MLYMDQSWLIVDCALTNIFQLNFNQHSHFLIQENAYENAVCKIMFFLVSA